MLSQISPNPIKFTSLLFGHRSLTNKATGRKRLANPDSVKDTCVNNNVGSGTQI